VCVCVCVCSHGWAFRGAARYRRLFKQATSRPHNATAQLTIQGAISSMGGWLTDWPLIHTHTHTQGKRKQAYYAHTPTQCNRSQATKTHYSRHMTAFYCTHTQVTVWQSCAPFSFLGDEFFFTGPRQILRYCFLKTRSRPSTFTHSVVQKGQITHTFTSECVDKHIKKGIKKKNHKQQTAGILMHRCV